MMGGEAGPAPLAYRTNSVGSAVRDAKRALGYTGS